jgi:hypothetical protein
LNRQLTGTPVVVDQSLARITWQTSAPPIVGYPWRLELDDPPAA